jgi:putative hemolysin
MMKINLSQIMTEAPFIMEHTTAYKALERFKKTGIHYALVQMNMVFSRSHNVE